MGDEVLEYHEAMGTLGCSEEFAHRGLRIADHWGRKGS
jgi:hypothetical protein